MAVTALDWYESFGYTTVLADIFNSTIIDGGATMTINATGGRGSRPCLQITPNDAGSGENKATKALNSASATKYASFNIRGDLPLGGVVLTLWEFLDSGSVQVDLRVNSNGDLFFTRAGTTLAGTTLTGVYTTGIDMHVQAKVVIHPSAGVVDLRLNASTSSAYGGEVGSLNTRATANSSVDGATLCVNNSGAYSGTWRFCDVLVNPDDWTGDVRVDYFPFNAAGTTTQWTPSTGSNHTTIDETGSKDTADYNATSTVGNKDTFNLGSVPSTAAIMAVCKVGLFDKQDAGAASCAFVLRSGGTDYDGTNFSPPFGTPQYFKEENFVNPNTSAAFTPTEFNALEGGYKRTA